MPLYTFGMAYGLYRSGLLLLKNIFVAERSIGNRIRPIWTASKDQSIELAVSTFGNFRKTKGIGA